jgi:hypothetical protein
MHDAEFDRLEALYPLSTQWARPSLLRHTTQIGTTEIQLIGLTATRTDGHCVTGSAGGLGEPPVARAYFELVERTSIVEAMTGESAVFEAFDYDRSPAGNVDKDDVFPRSPDEQHWRYARSNGVAVGIDWVNACRRAELELYERDRILRSWYGALRPERVDVPRKLLPESLEAHFELGAYVFREPGGVAPLVTVSAVVGFPRDAASPLLLGLGARESEVESLSAAANECLQRLGFLWGEAPVSEPPNFEPTPDFHQDYYLYPPNHVQVRAWLRGEHQAFSGLVGDVNAEGPRRRFVDLTPHALRSKLVVVRALPSTELPLTFGRGHPVLRTPLPEALSIHPIA